ncbi:MAG: hypothetical protein J0L84_00205 [Verrucomicrobia bacterium]|nr:hypothetical protein [Verrucomicrobiota bacterium]
MQGTPSWTDRILVLWLWGALLTGGPAAAGPIADLPSPPGDAITAEDVVRRLLERVEAAATNTPCAEAVTLRRITVIEELDSRGRVKERKTKEHSVILRGADQEATLVRINGEAPSDSERRRELRREEGDRDKFSPRRDRSTGSTHRIGRDLLERFEYRLLGSEEVDGRLAHLLGFNPRPAAEGGKMADRVLGGLRGRLWVDALEFEPVRIEARLDAPVSIGGFLAVLDEFRMDVERRRLPSGLWVDQRVDTHVGGRKLIQRFHGHFEVLQDPFVPGTSETEAGADGPSP